MNLRSDNEAPGAPQILQALIAANAGPAHAYGRDGWSEQLNERFSEVFETDTLVYPVATGTAANALAVAQACPPYGAVFCHQTAHLNVDECGAPEFYAHGAKLVPLAGAHGKLAPDPIRAAIDLLGDDVHQPQPALLSLTQATECGTVYSRTEIEALTALARAHGLRCHLDGARFANALVATGATPAALTWRAGIDLMSFGATKNGALGAEALLFFDRALAAGFARRRMQAGHLLSKQRYASAQLLAYLDQDLWLVTARRANEAARRIGAALDAHPQATLIHPVEINQVFARVEPELDATLRAAGIEYLSWPGEPDLYRMVAPYNLEEQQLERFEALLEVGAAG